MNEAECEDRLREILAAQLPTDETIAALKQVIRWYFRRGYCRGVDDNNLANGRSIGIRLEVEELNTPP